jgi:hypothetical protein
MTMTLPMRGANAHFIGIPWASADAFRRSLPKRRFLTEPPLFIFVKNSIAACEMIPIDSAIP